MAQQQKNRPQQTQNNPQSARQVDDQQSPANEILAAVTPAFQEARRYIETSPVAAAAIGAVAGGLIMTLFSTEKGRNFARAAYNYANPMIAKYARDYVTKASGTLTDQVLAQH